MSGIYIPGMEMPKNCGKCGWYSFIEEVCRVKRREIIATDDVYLSRHKDCPLVPVPEHEQILRVLKTERECVSRDCDRDCQKCDLSLEREAIVGVYDALIATLDHADKEVGG